MGHYAIDFGTSNSLMNYVDENGQISEIIFDQNGSRILRSIFYTPSQNKWYFGNQAILEYMNNDGEGRFFRSVKKFLPEPNYKGTIVHNKNFNISEIIATFLLEMKRKGDAQIGKKVETVVMGRPALYSLDKEEDALAENRMREACHLAGFKNVYFCPEPVAAGLDQRTKNSDNKIVLVVDLGGGTSDFTLMKTHQRPFQKEDILGLSGIFKAGDALDGDVMNQFIAKHLGSRFQYTLPGSENILTFPRQLLKKICSPAHITHLKERETWEHLQHIQKFAITENDRKALDQLFTVVECQLGFPLFEEIVKTKITLGEKLDYLFNYQYPGVKIQEQINKQQYENAIEETVHHIFNCMNEVFNQSQLDYHQVDEVRLTGGTSQLDLINKMLAEKFGQEKLVKNNIYQSVVNGLSHYKF